MPGQVPLEVRKERSKVMREVLQAAEQDYYRRFLGSEASVLWESTSTLGPDGWHLHGLSDNYLRVTAVSPQRLWNEISRVRLEDLTADEISAEILTD
jgi:threonylcarbamoyladenosine tRNA methylthiotransferase MtaB